MKAFVEAHPDAFLREIAAHFDCAVPSVWGALKQIHITLKKMTSFKEQDSEKVAEFLDILDNLKDLSVVYIGETGIDRYLYRPYARAPRGKKVYEKISGRRFERTSIVSGLVDGAVSYTHLDVYKRQVLNQRLWKSLPDGLKVVCEMPCLFWIKP